MAIGRIMECYRRVREHCQSGDFTAPCRTSLSAISSTGQMVGVAEAMRPVDAALAWIWKMLVSTTLLVWQLP